MAKSAVLPASAGMIPGVRHQGRLCHGAPRICGDDPARLACRPTI